MASLAGNRVATTGGYAFLCKVGKYPSAGQSMGCQDRHTQTHDDDELFLDAVDDAVLAALEEIGEDPAARFALFKSLLAAARAAIATHSRGGQDLLQ